MTRTVLILGANGRFGRAATQAFAIAGWQVHAATRTGNTPKMERITPLACDVMNRDSVIAASQGVDVIVHAVNPAYPDWAKMMPVHTDNIIAAGLATGATVMVAGNVYVFGENAAEVYEESNAFAPTTRKGALRVTMETAFEAAAVDGLRTVILRGGILSSRRNRVIGLTVISPTRFTKACLPIRAVWMQYMHGRTYLIWLGRWLNWLRRVTRCRRLAVSVSRGTA